MTDLKELLKELEEKHPEKLDDLERYLDILLDKYEGNRNE